MANNKLGTFADECIRMTYRNKDTELSFVNGFSSESFLKEKRLYYK